MSRPKKVVSAAALKLVKEEICRIGQSMCQKGYVGGRDGNISVRISAERILCTPTEISKGDMKASDIAVLDGRGNQLSGRLAVTSEFRMHLHIYRRCPDIKAIVHAHPPCATAFGVAAKVPPVGILPEVELTLGQIALAEYHMPGTDDVAAAVAARVAAGAKAVIMANHGAVTVGEKLLQTWWRMETLERYCQVVLMSEHLGGPRPLSARQLEELAEFKKKTRD